MLLTWCRINSLQANSGKCRTANYKLHALRRKIKYLSLEKAKLLCNTFINSQFKYAPYWCECFS